MCQSIELTNRSQSVRNSLSRSALRRGFLLIALALAWFALLPGARAVDPPPDGGYPNQNTAEGEDALFSLTTGVDNTAIGFHALYSNAAGNSNTAIGSLALANTLIGSNTAVGSGALSLNTIGYLNTAIGAGALNQNRTGKFNIAVGEAAMNSNVKGSGNTAVGFAALGQNQKGNNNCAFGENALQNNVGGDFNVAIGSNALASNKGSRNIAIGVDTLQFNTAGEDNVAIGHLAGSSLANTTGSNNIALGASAGGALTTGKNNIDIGNSGVAGESNKIRIGTAGTQEATFIAGITGVTVPGGVGVIVGSDGKLGTVVSSERFKDSIQPRDNASEAILALKPVTFRYKHELDPDGIPQFGLLAEQVEKVNPDLVARDDKGKPYTVRYEAVNAMLLNEFLKEHQKVEKLDAMVAQQQRNFQAIIVQQKKHFESAITQQQKEIEALTANLKEQASKIQKVSDQLEVSQAAARVVANNQ